MLLKVHLSPKGGAREMEKRKKYERARENTGYFWSLDSQTEWGGKKNEKRRCREKGKQQPESYLKLDESVHGSIDMDVNRETFK